MFRNNRCEYFILLIGFLLIIIACSSRDKDRVAVARVGDKYLYLDEVEHLIPENAKESDSIFAVRAYADNWIRRQIILEYAEQNIKDIKPDFERQIKEYRNALMIFAYEQELVNQKLDTNVSDQEISRYYHENIDDFILKENIVKVLYVKLFLNDPTAPRFRRLMRSNRQSDRLELAKLAKENAANYYLDDNAWLFFNDLLKEIPITTYNQEAFLNHNRSIEIKDSSYLYMVNIKDFRVTDNHSPLSFERERIRNTIINKRKTSIINNMSRELYDRAAQRKKFETFF